MNKIFIKDEHLQMLMHIFNNYCPKAEILAYGSRIKNTAHVGSDLDLTIKNWGEKNKNIDKLRNILKESNIPFVVDINEYNSLPESFKKEILLNFVKIYG